MSETTYDIGARDLVIGVVGAGLMGRGIAQIAATGGIKVRLYDTRAGAAAEARDFAAGMIARAAEKGRLDAATAKRAPDNLIVAEALTDLADCRVVVEAIVEQVAPKQDLFKALEEIVADDAILATNTSSLSVTAIAATCRRPQRVAGFHFFNPVPLMKVVEVIDGARTEPAVCDALTDLAERMGHRPVRAKDTPGFLVNHAGRGYGTEALRIVAEGAATHADIDRVLREAAGFPMGPFELMDLTGLDVSHTVMESIYHQFYEEPRFRPQPETARRFAAGLFGRKVGEGFYAYDGKTMAVPDEPPVPDALPHAVWISEVHRDAREALAEALRPSGVKILDDAAPPADALCLVTPLGSDATHAALAEGLDPTRVVAVDTLLGFDKRITVMANPATAKAQRDAAHALLATTGQPVTAIADSPGFIAQRVLAHVVNVAAEIAQQRIATPADIDAAVRLGLGYPAGPLTWGDRLGARRLLTILETMQRITGDPRYRPSLWLRRRALLGLSLTAPDLAE